DLVEPYDLAGLERQQRDQAADTGTADRDGLVAVEELNGPEQLEPGLGHARAHLPGSTVSPASPPPEKSTYRDDRAANTAPPGRDQDISSRCGFRSGRGRGLRLTPDMTEPRTTGPDPVV